MLCIARSNKRDTSTADTRKETVQLYALAYFNSCFVRLHCLVSSD